MKGRITITETQAGAVVRQADEINEQKMFQNCAPFSDCISQENNR